VAGLGYARRRAADPALRAPLLLNPQGMEEHKTRGLKRLALTHLRRLSRETARLSDRVIATDEVTKDEVPHFLGVDPGRVVVLPNGIDLDEIAEATPQDPRAVVRALAPSLGSASPVLISVGRLEPYKGFGDVLEALLVLLGRAALPDGWAWLVIGDGPQKASLQKRMAAWDRANPHRPVTPRVHFLGWIRDNPTLHACYATANLFVHATHYEGSSIVTLEAMAHGLPVVATRAGGIPDKVVEGRTGSLVAPGDVPGLADALARMAAAGDTRRTMGQAGRARALAHFSWDVIVDRVLALYAELRA
jgi:glycosyltransferase involved in cell wall biosynthesis